MPDKAALDSNIIAAILVSMGHDFSAMEIIHVKLPFGQKFTYLFMA